MILNLTKKNVVARKPLFLYGIISNIRGMLNRQFTECDAFVFQNCQGLLFLKASTDVLFIDRENGVCRTIKAIKPWAFSKRCNNAVSVICLPHGKISEYRIELGDKLDLNAEITVDLKKQLKKVEALIDVAPKTAFHNATDGK